MAASPEELTRHMIDDLREIVFRTDAAGRWTFLNPAWQEITGFAVSESLGTSFLGYIHPDDRVTTLERFRPLVEGHKEHCRHELRYLRKDGTHCWVEVHARAIVDDSGALAGTCGTISNIHERHTVLQTLQGREAVLEAIGAIAQLFLQGEDWEAAIPSALQRLGPAAGADRVAVLQSVEADGVLMVMPRHVWTAPGAPRPALDRAIPAVEEWELALERGEVINGAVSSFAPGIRAMLERDGIRHLAIVPILAGGILWGDLSFIRFSDDPWASATVEGLRVAGGIIGAAIRQSASQERLRMAHAELEKRVEERTAELRRSEQRFHGIFDQAPIGMVLADGEGRIHFSNASFERMVEYTQKELASLGVMGITHPADHAESVRLVRGATCKSRGIDQIEKRYIAKSGREVFARTTVANLCFDRDDPTYTLAMVEDITSRKKLEEEFLHAQRMEAVGRLTGGIAHDFNNILTVIKGYGELLMKSLEHDQRSFRKASQIVKTSERASNLVNQLLAFSRKQALEPKVMDVNAALQEMHGMLRRLLREDIELSLQLDPGAGSVMMDPGQFGQLLMNLAANARDAIRASGRVTISTRRWVGTGENEGPYAVVEVGDSGCGMAPDVRSRIFEPFFTTKDVGKGTGLGLSTVYGIVQQAGGFVNVESTPGSGTTFQIHLPAAVKPASAVAPLQPAAANARGTETILIAEDEDEVRKLIVETLRDHGYTVFAARHGLDAIEIARRHRGSIDLLLTDVVMPRMGGPELWDNLWERFPDMRFLFTSGHPGEEFDHDPAILHKPFSAGELTARVREILDAPRTAGVLPRK